MRNPFCERAEQAKRKIAKKAGNLPANLLKSILFFFKRNDAIIFK